MELGCILTHLDKKGEKCDISNLRLAGKSAATRSMQYTGSKIDLSLLGKCNGTDFSEYSSFYGEAMVYSFYESHVVKRIFADVLNKACNEVFGADCVSDSTEVYDISQSHTRRKRQAVPSVNSWIEYKIGYQFRLRRSMIMNMDYQMFESKIMEYAHQANISVVYARSITDETVLPELNCSDIHSIILHLNNTCKSVNFLNTTDTTSYCKNYNRTLLCAKLAFSWKPYMGKCNDSMMVSTIQANQEKFTEAFGGNYSTCNAYKNGMVLYQDMNGNPIDNITNLQSRLPCENNTIQYIAKYNCYGMLEKNMSIGVMERSLIKNDTCGAAAWTKSCVHNTMHDWANTSCYAVEDVLKINSKTIFGKTIHFENCSSDVCSSYGQLSVANNNWTNCMELLIFAMTENRNSSTSVNKNDAHLAMCKMYNMSMECIMNSTRTKGHNCSRSALKWTVPAIRNAVYSSEMSEIWHHTNASTFDADTCPGNSSDGQLCALPAYLLAPTHSNHYYSLYNKCMMGTSYLLYQLASNMYSHYLSNFTTDRPFTNGTANQQNITTGADSMNGSSTHQNGSYNGEMYYPMNTVNTSLIPPHLQSLVCSVYEMELGCILTHLDREGEKCDISNLRLSGKMAATRSMQYIGSKVDLSLLGKCNGTVEKLNGSICNHPNKLMLKLTSQCLHSLYLWSWSDPTDECWSFKAFKQCIHQPYMLITDGEMCTENQKAQAWNEGQHWKNVLYPHVNVTMCDS
ncbi:hypothetical protein KP79_PYT17428 [Mizuhopecten yessoensis]|uniref:Uncharacterized protein n=1 Tax=Mizuhopecten yessoensis TaxID=6573 RepID=A0A210QSP4_MIZYE|nr:hypothetical protein KP79_PYT17428 [Mizuhopecten yessoensis]